MAKRGKRAHPEAWHHMLHQGLKTTRPLETIPIHSEYMRPRQDRVNAAIAINYEWINQFVHTNHMDQLIPCRRHKKYGITAVHSRDSTHNANNYNYNGTAVQVVTSRHSNSWITKDCKLQCHRYIPDEAIETINPFRF